MYYHNYFTDLSIASPSPTVPVDQLSGVSGGAIAGAVIAVIILAVLVTAVAVIVIVIYRKGLCLFCEPQVVFYLLLGYCKKSKSDRELLVVGYSKSLCSSLLLLSDELLFLDKEYQCVCHVFCQEVCLNSWKVVFVLVPSRADLEVRVSDLCITV